MELDNIRKREERGKLVRFNNMSAVEALAQQRAIEMADQRPTKSIEQIIAAGKRRDGLDQPLLTGKGGMTGAQKM